jgi:ABC-type transport system involved in cytochrome c biogenesis permease subunit
MVGAPACSGTIASLSTPRRRATLSFNGAGIGAGLCIRQPALRYQVRHHSMLNRLANPARFLKFSVAITPWLAAATLLLLAVGLYLALFASPADYQQGETVRSMYGHVPAAWMALFC